MKKSIKILITSCIAAVGVGASFGGSYALYQKNATPTEFSIGTYTHTSTGTVSYKIGTVVNSLGEAKVDPEHKTFVLKAPLGGEYSSDVPAQSVVYGSLSVKATISAGLVDNVKWSVWVEGYKDNENKEDPEHPYKTYWSNWDKVNDELAPRKYTDGDTLLTATETTIKKDMVVEAVADPVIAENPEDQLGQYICVYFEYTNMTEDNFLDYAESSVVIDFSFNEPENAEIPLIKGDKTGWSSTALEYRMVPNIQANTLEWMYEGLTGFKKLYIHDARTGGDENVYYVKAKNEADQDDDGNLVVDESKTYSLYYQYQTGAYGDKYVLVINGTTIYPEA